MGIWKIGISLRIREDLREEMIGFAKREKRSFGNLGAILLEWSIERLKVFGQHERVVRTFQQAIKQCHTRQAKERSRRS